MTSKMHLATRKVCAAVLGALCAHAAFSATEDDPTTGLQELDEVWVYGESLVQRIETAEDAFFERYNALNTTRRYDVVCGMTSLDPDSMTMVRKCVPEFRVSYAPVSYYVPSPSSTSPACNNGAFGRANWPSHLGHGGPCVHAPGREVFVRTTSPENDAEYARHVIRVISSDQGLLEQAGELRELYDALESTQKRFLELKPPRKSGRMRAPRGM